MQGNSNACPICGDPFANFASGPSKRYFELIWDGTCQRCGRVRITDEARAKVNGAGHSIPSKDQSYLLSAFFRRFGTGSADQLVTTRDVESLLRDLPQYTPMEKRDLLLQYAAAKSSKPGERSEYDSHRDYPILFARDEQEADFYVESLFRSGYVVFPPDNDVVVTLDGWQRAMDLNQRGKTSPRTFVAMSFDPSRTALMNKASVLREIWRTLLPRPTLELQPGSLTKKTRSLCSQEAGFRVTISSNPVG